MSLLDPAAVKAPSLPQESVPMASLGGDVLVRGPIASERLALHRRMRAAAEPAAIAPDAAAPDATASGGTTRDHSSYILSLSVYGPDGLTPFFTEQQWEIFGGTNWDDWCSVFAVACRLWGFDRDDAKKN